MIHVIPSLFDRQISRMIDVEHICMDDLPEDCRQIAEKIGLDNMLMLIQVFAGERIYFPTMERIAMNARNRAICADFNGRNYRELAHRYGLTTTWIRKIVAPNKKDE